MDYAELISKAVLEKNWNEVINLANNAKNETKGFLGMQKDAYNVVVFSQYSPIGEIRKSFSECGFTVEYVDDVSEFKKKLPKLELGMIILTPKRTVLDNFYRTKLPINRYSLSASFSKFWFLKNEEEAKIDISPLVLKAKFRDYQIKTILD